MGLKSGTIVPFQYKNCKKLLMIGGPDEERSLTLSDFKTAIWAAFGVYEFEFRNKKIDFHIPDQLLLQYLEQRRDVTNFVIEIVEVTPLEPQIQIQEVRTAECTNRNKSTIHFESSDVVQVSSLPSSSTAEPNITLSPKRKRRRIYTPRDPQPATSSEVSNDLEPDDRFESIFSTFDGKIVLNNFQKCQRLQEDDRRALSRLIIAKEFENSDSLKITRERFMKLSYLICAKFPSEIPEIYFVPYSPVTKKVARGKLWECYNNCKRRFKNSARRHFPVSDADQSACDDHIKFLVKNDSPWETVLMMWEDSYEYRRSELSAGDGYAVHYFNKYPCLKKLNGYELLEQDFDRIFPEKGDLLLDKWETISEKIIAAALARYKNAITQVIEEYGHERTMCALMLMPYLLQVSKRNYNEFSRTNPENIVIHLPEINPDEKLFKQFVRPATGDDLEPYVVVVGKADDGYSCYVVIDETIYCMDSPIKAIDICFKAYHALNLMYPPKQDQSWLLLQRVGYDIVTDKDGPNTTLSSFLADVFA